MLVMIAFATIGLTSILALGQSFGQSVYSYLLKNTILVLISDILFSLQSTIFFTVKVPVDGLNPYLLITYIVLGCIKGSVASRSREEFCPSVPLW